MDPCDGAQLFVGIASFHCKPDRLCLDDFSGLWMGWIRCIDYPEDWCEVGSV